MKHAYHGPVERVGDCRWRIPQSYDPAMRVPGMIYASDELMASVTLDNAPQQVANVASLPGIQTHSLGMPDIHWGYGFCIGGVAATDPDQGGVISPGGVGYDINCGVRLVRTNLTLADVKPRLKQLVDELFHSVPCGTGQHSFLSLSRAQLDQVLSQGPQWLVRKGYGTADDVEHTEERGCLAGADPDHVSERAHQRGSDQLGTLGSGNHFIEIQVVDQVFDPDVAKVMGLELGQVAVMVHSGSRGLGYQVCDDYLMVTSKAVKRYGIELPDRQLACVPVRSDEGQRYLSAMRAAANYAWANRHLITHQVREVFGSVFGRRWEDLDMALIYDVCHNIAKLEPHQVEGQTKTLCVHRKGATRAFPPGHPAVPEAYRAIGQPVLIPGDMGTHSYVLVGTDTAMRETFGTTCHGAGRLMSRTAARKLCHGKAVANELASRGIITRARSFAGLAEEQPAAYKDVDLVVDTAHRAGLSRKVARLRPLGVTKG